MKKKKISESQNFVVSELLRKASDEPVENLFKDFSTSEKGLLNQEAVEKSLDQNGTNKIVRGKQKPAIVRFFLSFANPFTVVLLVLAFVSFLTDFILQPAGNKDPSSAIIILTLVLGSGLFRFFQESRSGKALEKLSDLVETTAAVTRWGKNKEIPLDEIVVGDVVYVAVGDLIPADVRIISAKDLFVSQSALTGESEPVEKSPLLLGTPTSITDRSNLAFMGSTVVSGSGLAVVVSVGNNTFLGQAARRLNTKPEKTAFDKGVDSLSWLLVRFMLVMAPAVFLINGLTKNDWLDSFLFAISVAVGLTPEMLPMIVTTCLAKGAIAMGKKKVVVKNINSIQNFGAIDVLCTDKTGTLTQDRVALEDHLNVNGITDPRVLKYAFLNSYYQTGLKNLMDKSIIEKTRELSTKYPGLIGLDKAYSKVDEIPFDFERKRMSVVVKSSSGHIQMITKGALEEILSVCSRVEIDDVVTPLSPALEDSIRKKVEAFSEKGFRTIAVARKSDPGEAGALGVKDETAMTLIGYLTFYDPPKDSAPSALKELQKEGVTIKVLTGDGLEVTRYICEKVGLRTDRVLLGQDIESMDESALKKAAEETTIFAKLSPDDKARVVTALKENGHVVGYMGDGINDAPALKVADIGISVDTAVDIAKETAHVILLEKDLGVLSDGIIEGRKTYANMTKYIKMTASSNFGNIFSELAAAAFLPFLPMLPLHLLILNLIYDISCIAIPFDNVDSDYLAKPRKWDSASIGKFMLWMGPTSSVFDWITYLVMYFIICPLFAGGNYGTSSCNSALFITLFQTGWFVESMWSQSLVIHMIRTDKIPLFQSRASWQLMMATGLALALTTSLAFIPDVNSHLHLTALPWPYFLFLAAVVLCYMLLANFVKNCYRRRYGEVI